MDEATLCRMLRSSKDKGYVYFVMLTGKDKKEDVIEGLKAGVDDYVVKPFDRSELQVRGKGRRAHINSRKELTAKMKACRD